MKIAPKAGPVIECVESSDTLFIVCRVRDMEGNFLRDVQLMEFPAAQRSEAAAALSVCRAAIYAAAAGIDEAVVRQSLASCDAFLQNNRFSLPPDMDLLFYRVDTFESVFAWRDSYRDLCYVIVPGVSVTTRPTKRFMEKCGMEIPTTEETDHHSPSGE